MIKAASWYLKNGYSVIPIDTQNKKPRIEWKMYQETKPTESDIKSWWGRWPDAGVGIVTGKISGVTVIDVDNDEGMEALSNFLPDSLVTPVAASPHGKHFYFAYREGLPNRARVITGCDVRTDGGYIIAPPSRNSEAGYVWQDGLRISDVPLASMPDMLYDIIISSSNNIYSSIYNSNNRAKNDVLTQSSRCPHDSSLELFTEGMRDETLFHVANHLVKGKMPIENIRKILHFLANHCDPPFTQNETEAKIKSAIERSKKVEKSLAEEIREFVLSSNGIFLSSDIISCHQLSSRQDRKNVSNILGRLVDDGLIERYGNRNGQFRRIQNEAPDINIFEIQGDPLPIQYPLNLHSYFITLPKNIVVVAGTQDSGKSAFLLRCAAMNMNNKKLPPIRYMTSEMGGMELRGRLEDFSDIPLSDWSNVNFKEVSSNFQDYVLPDAINIIDYLEVSDSFWLVADSLKKIFDRLKGGVCLVALQKDFKTELGRGGSFSLEKPRLYITLTSNPPEGGIAKIVKCKNWKMKDYNPNGRICNFKIRHGNEIRQVTEWNYANK